MEKDMKNVIEIYPSKEHTAKAYEIFCEKRFRALLVEKAGETIYQGDQLAITLFCGELRLSGVLYSNISKKD